MIAIRRKFRNEPDVSAQKYCIRLNVPSTDREDAWEICGVIQRLGGVEVSDCCFAFANEPRRLMALETLRGQFGTHYFEALGPTDDLSI